MRDKKLKIRTYRPEDEIAIIKLWKECDLLVPWNNPHRDIERKQSDSPELFFVGLINEKLVSTCMAGYDGHRGWLYFLAVDGEFRKRGIAAKVVAHAENKLKEAGCPKIDLMVRNTNEGVITFYESIAYKLDPVVVLSKRLIEDEPHSFS